MFRKEISLLQWLSGEIKSTLVIFVLFPLVAIVFFLLVVSGIKTGIIWWILLLIALLFSMFVFIERLIIKKQEKEIARKIKEEADKLKTEQKNSVKYVIIK